MDTSAPKLAPLSGLRMSCETQFQIWIARFAFQDQNQSVDCINNGHRNQTCVVPINIGGAKNIVIKHEVPHVGFS